jgi:FkbM family methyltransferase
MIKDIIKRTAARLPLPTHMMNKYLEWQEIRKVLSSLAINCVLDVGANRGQFAENLRQIGYNGHIVSFEPVPEAYRMMEAQFGSDPRWQGKNIALGSRDTAQPFHVALESSEMSSFLSPLDPDWNLRTEPVMMMRLDSLFDQIVADIPGTPRIFLKMDTQGYDLEVVRGATQCLSQILGLQSELSVSPLYQGMPPYLESLAAYQDLGFRLVCLAEAARADEDRYLTELNCLMTRPDGVSPKTD